ncbi:MAG: metallophosphoesterase [Burkholderiales bacterium]|nr:metallophosphoesterase [Burkholderiales bacterium]
MTKARSRAPLRRRDAAGALRRVVILRECAARVQAGAPRRACRLRAIVIRRLVLLAVLAHLYVGLRIVPDLPLGAFGAAAAILYLAVSAALMPLAMASRRMPERRLADRIAWAGFLAMGAFSSLWLLTVVRDLCLLAGHGLDAWLGMPDLLARLAASSAAAVPLLAVGMTAWGLRNARRCPPVRTIEIPIAGLAPALHGFTIAQITDVHVGPTIKREYLDAIVRAVNALEPDLVAVTGDMVDGSAGQIGRELEPLARLRSRHGSFFVTGNHEYYSGAHAWIAQMRRLGQRVLLNEHVVLEHRGAALVVGGVTDIGAHHFDPLHASDPAAAIAGAPAVTRVLLAHQPRSAFAAAQAGFHVQLSGHTHGGQFVPWNLVVRRVQPFAVGLHRWRGLWIYTSRGAGYWGPPLRLGAPSEISRIRLVAERRVSEATLR